MFQGITNQLTTMAWDINKERTLDMKKLFATGLVILALLVIGVGQTKPNAATAKTATCQPGTYKASDGTCVHCQPGTFSSTPDATQCTFTPKGTFVASPGSTSPTVCAANTYAPNFGSISCQPCPNGTTSGPGAYECRQNTLPVKNAIGKDEELLKQLVRDWANAVVKRDAGALERILADEFQGDSDGLKTTKTIQVAALKSGLASAEGWSVEDLQVVTDGSTAEVKGRSTLTKCIYNGQDYSGVWEWTDRFVKQKDGSWKAVSLKAHRIK